ncbi:MAG: hypothetical protein WBA12_10925 [Catalinimonas sp.]
MTNRRLDGFSYRIDDGYLGLVLGGAPALLVAWLTVGLRSYRAARADSVRSLRSE